MMTSDEPASRRQDVPVPRRDWILLPLLSLLTIAALVAGTLWLSVRFWGVSDTNILPCLALDDESTGVRGVPHTVCTQKVAESRLVVYQFNACGHRAGMECGPKPAGTYRIVMVGSSADFGQDVAREQSFAALLPKALEESTGRRIELYNEAIEWGFPASMSRRLDGVLAAQPDLILWPLNATDIQYEAIVVPERVAFREVPEAIRHAGFVTRTWYRLKVAFGGGSLRKAFSVLQDNAMTLFKESPPGMMLEDLLHVSRSLYLDAYLAGSEGEMGFLRDHLGEPWQSRLRRLDQDLAEVARRAKAAGVPLVVTLLPIRPQAALISAGQWKEGYNPYRIDEELRRIVLSHDGIFIDILPDVRGVAHAERGFFAADGHPNEAGHAMLSGLIARRLVDNLSARAARLVAPFKSRESVDSP